MIATHNKHSADDHSGQDSDGIKRKIGSAFLFFSCFFRRRVAGEGFLFGRGGIVNQLGLILDDFGVDGGVVVVRCFGLDFVVLLVVVSHHTRTL